MNYLIHAYEPRLWYVNEFLMPSMINQGIKKEDINIFTDDGSLGNLKAAMESFKNLPDDDSATWHLQDDICISSDFAKVTRNYENEYAIVCGYCYCRDEYSIIKKGGEVGAKDMWHSFPCIMIPNKIAIECSEWFYSDALYRPEFKEWVDENKYDDAFFKKFIEENYQRLGVKIINYIPNLVDHIDYLIGGSTVNKEREKWYKQSRAAWFSDRHLIDKLTVRLEERKMEAK